ncbi:PQQ-like beta-propeller repeat protein [Actinoplanes cyaneus]|uniref:PQQ-like beta-propeller repeat protein n=1 Tax=Actinoplanes cyaneus TaxID=52696 RepID=UPI002225CF9D|nr:PQQ-like beta-propeller repeat protein [Actinoplanes cyaneus]
MTRVLLRGSAAVLLLLATVLVGWRILKPAEVLATAKTPYPPLVIAQRGAFAHVNVAPLIFQDRLRIYAAKHQVRADDPIYAHGLNTTRWSLRRWPAQLSGVVTDDTMVITRWSDGVVVGLDGRTGNVAWRADGPDAPDYAGHRTGAPTVWNPPDLRVSSGTVLVTAGQELIAYDASTGAERWRATAPVDCTNGFTTAGGAYVCGNTSYALTTGQPVAGWPTGPFTAVGCPVGHSNCLGFRDGASHGWRTSLLQPRRAVALDTPGTTVAGGIVVGVQGRVVTGYRDDGTKVWTWNGLAKVLGGPPGRLLLTPKNDLVALDPSTGLRQYRFRLGVSKREEIDWNVGAVQVSEHYMAIERLRKGGSKDPESPTHFFSANMVLIVSI